MPNETTYYLDFDSSNGILRCRLAGDVTDESLKECYEVTGKYAALTNPDVGIMDFSLLVKSTRDFLASGAVCAASALF